MIGGNTIATFQLRTTTTKNKIGEAVSTWEDVRSLKGFLRRAQEVMKGLGK